MLKVSSARPSPAMVVAVVALSFALAGSAVAGTEAVTSKLDKKEKRQVKKISKRQANKQIKKKAPGLSVANAENAVNATNLVGHEPFFIKLSFGQSQVIAQNGTVSLTAVCDQDAGNDRIRILAATTQDGAILKSDEDNLLGPGADPPEDAFLNTTTLEADREFVEVTDTTGDTTAFFELDGGYVLGPDGKMISLEEEGLLLAVNHLGSNCVLAGITDKLG